MREKHIFLVFLSPNQVGVQKYVRILVVGVTGNEGRSINNPRCYLNKQHHRVIRYSRHLGDYKPCAGRLSAVNATATCA